MDTNVSEEQGASVFKFDPEDGGRKHRHPYARVHAVIIPQSIST
jgi:hypothetical protein